MSATDINSANAALQAALVNPDPQIALTLANSLWMHLSDNPVVPAFTQVNRPITARRSGIWRARPNPQVFFGKVCRSRIAQIDAALLQ
jgi:hypothetical protein